MKLSVLLVTLAFVAVPAIGAEPADRNKTAPAQTWTSNVQNLLVLDEKRPVLVRLRVEIDGKPYQEAWHGFVKEFFTSLDADKSGFLSPKEFAQVPNPALIFNPASVNRTVVNPNQRGSSGAPRFSDLDADNDEKGTLQEFVAFCLANDVGPFNSHVQETGLSPTALTQSAFDKLDQNKDGKLSKEESARAWTVLRKLDVNDDEVLTPAELLGQTSSPSEFGFDAVRVASPDAATPGIAGTPFAVVYPAASADLWTKFVMSRYSKDGKKIDRKQMGLDEPAFNRLDKNKDGSLNEAELERLLDFLPDIELFIRLGKRADGQPMIDVSTPLTLPPSIKLIGGKSGNESALEIGLFRIEFHAESEPPAAEVTALRQSYLQQFRAADRDRNGYLEYPEVRLNPAFRGIFRAADLDGDKKVYQKELIKYLDQFQAWQSKASATRTLLTIKEGMGFFDLLDANHDGRWAVRELMDTPKLIAQLDRDQDGQLTSKEISRSFELTVGRGAAAKPSGQRGRPANLLAAKKPAAPKSSPIWFQKMDRNRDGYLSPREFLGTAAEFQTLDTDRDGFVSPEEAERAAQKQDSQ